MAGSSVIGALRVVLGLDTAQFETGAKGAEKRAEALGFKIGASLRSASKSALDFGKSFGGLGVAVGAAAFGAAAAKALDLASSLGETAQQLGVTTKDLQEYRYAATQVGISQEEMDKGLAKLTVSMGQARAGVDKPKKAFAELSALLGKDVLKSAETAGDAIPLIADALAKIKDSAGRAALEVALFGKTGQRLDTLLAGGSSAVNSLRDAAHSLGIVLSDQQIQDADKIADRLTELKLVLEANIAGAVTQNADAIYGFVDALGKFISYAPKAIGWLMQIRADLAWSQALLSGDVAGMAKAANERTYYGNRGQPGWTDKIQSSSRAYADAATRRPAAGAGTSDGERAKADRDVAAASRNAASDANRAVADSARQAKEARRNRERYEDDLRQGEERQMDLEGQLTSSLADRAKYELRRIDLEKEAYDEQLKRRMRDGELTQAQAHRLQLGNNYNVLLQQSLVTEKLEEDQRRAALDLRKGEIDLERESLQGALDGARTQDERRRIQLEMLDLAYEQRRLDQEAVIASRESTDAQKELARKTLDKLDQFHAADARGIERQTLGPLAEYLDKIPKSTAEMNEAFQKVAVDGLGSLNDGLVDAITGAKSLGDVFKGVADQIIADLIRIAIQKTITNALGKALGGLFGDGGDSWFNPGGESGGGIGSALSGLFGGGSGGELSVGTISEAGAVPGFATGGSFRIASGAEGIDRNVLAINGIPKARVNYGERVTITPANDRGAAAVARVEIVEHPAFASRVVGISDGVSVERIGQTRRDAARRGRQSLLRR